MPTPRESVAAQIAADHTDWDVYSFPLDVKEVAKPAVVVVYRTTVTPAATNLDHELTCQLYGRGSGGEKTEADLDSRLDDVMLSLQRLAGVQVRKAERKVFADVFHGWELDLLWVSSDIYRSQV